MHHQIALFLVTLTVKLTNGSLPLWHFLLKVRTIAWHKWVQGWIMERLTFFSKETEFLQHEGDGFILLGKIIVQLHDEHLLVDHTNDIQMLDWILLLVTEQSLSQA